MKPNLKKPVHFFALGFGSGLLKPAPGTWGTLMGLLVAIFLWELTACQSFFMFLTLTGFLCGCYICQKASEDLGVHDDGRIVWDEIIAIFLIFTFLPEYNWIYYALTFVIFRFFDILKPYPIRFFDQKLTSGLGIMFDDILAALYSILMLHFIYWYI